MDGNPRSLGGAALQVRPQKVQNAWEPGWMTRRKAPEREVSDISEEEKQKLVVICTMIYVSNLLCGNAASFHPAPSGKEGSAEPERLQELTHHLRKCMVTARHMARGLSTLELGQSGLCFHCPLAGKPESFGALSDTLESISRVVFERTGHGHSYLSHHPRGGSKCHQAFSWRPIIVRLILRIRLRLSIEDNGVGMAEGAATHSRGLGMKTGVTAAVCCVLLFEANAHGGLTLSCKIPFSIPLESPEPDS